MLPEDAALLPEPRDPRAALRVARARPPPRRHGRHAAQDPLELPTALAAVRRLSVRLDRILHRLLQPRVPQLPARRPWLRLLSRRISRRPLGHRLGQSRQMSPRHAGSTSGQPLPLLVVDANLTVLQDDMSRTEQLSTKLRTLTYDHERLLTMERTAKEKAANAEKEVSLSKTRLTYAPSLSLYRPCSLL